MKGDLWRLALLALVACALAAAAIGVVLRMRLTPAEREKRRRGMLNRMGRMMDAVLTDAQENTLYYQYSVNGVDYEASQDVTGLGERVPTNPALLIGNVTMKYSPRNPANSILVCEDWSGLRTKPMEAYTQEETK